MSAVSSAEHTAPTARRVAIVGGGVSGLTAAYRIVQSHVDAFVTVFEANNHTGGCLKASDLGGYAPLGADVGAEASLFVRPETRALAAELGLTLAFPSRAHHSQLYARGAFHRLPPGTLMGVPSAPEVLAGILSPAGLERLQHEDLDATFPTGPGDTFDPAVGEFLAARLGDEVVDTVIDPLLAGVYSGRARDLSLKATLPALVPAAQSGQSVFSAVTQILHQRTPAQGANIPGTQNSAATQNVTHSQPPAPPVFMSLPGGINQLTQALAGQVRAHGGRIVTSAAVTEISREGEHYTLTVDHSLGHPGFDVVILAVPVETTGRLLADLAPGAARAARQVPSADSAVVTAVLELSEELTGSGFLVAPTDTVFVKASTFASNKWPWLATVLDPGLAVVRMSVGRYGDRADLWQNLSDGEVAQRAVSDWLRLTGRRDRVVHVEVQRWLGALPQYLPGHTEVVAGLDAHLRRVPGLGIVGNAFDGVGIPACLARVERELKRLGLSEAPDEKS